MSKRNGLRENETKQNEADAWVSIREAAALLGITERALQMQAKAGRMSSRKIGGRWQVQINEANEAHETKDSRKRNEADEATKLDIKVLIAEKDARIADLQRELEQRNRGESELRTLMLADRRELQELRQRIALLLPAPPEEDALPVELTQPASPGAVPDGEEGKRGQSTPTKPRRRFWQFWKRT